MQRGRVMREFPVSLASRVNNENNNNNRMDGMDGWHASQSERLTIDARRSIQNASRNVSSNRNCVERQAIGNKINNCSTPQPYVDVPPLVPWWLLVRSARISDHGESHHLHFSLSAIRRFQQLFVPLLNWLSLPFPHQPITLIDFTQ